MEIVGVRAYVQFSPVFDIGHSDSQKSMLEYV